MEMVVGWEVIGLFVLNTAAAIGCTVGYYREHGRRVRLWAQNVQLRADHTDAAIENIALRKTNKSQEAELGRLGFRNRMLAVELRGSDGTAPTCVWRHAKPEVWQR